MLPIRLLLLCLCGIQFAFSQVTQLQGEIFAEGNIEGIHIINKSYNVYTTTNAKGKFNIRVNVNDTLVISSLQHKLISLVVDDKMVANKHLVVVLETLVNELDEVVLAPRFTGDLTKDIKGLGEQRSINFYDVGIPGYTGKPKTHSEKLLNEADAGPFVVFAGPFVAVNIHKILNRITGRTKHLKNRVALEAKDALMYTLKTKLSETFFSSHPLPKAEHLPFWFFCQESKDFEQRCRNASDLEVLQFLEEKYVIYLKQKE